MADRLKATSWSERRARVAELLARHEREQVTFKQLAIEAGIVLPTLYAWVQRLRREQRGPVAGSARDFVELEASDGVRDASGIEIVLRSGLRVCIDADFHEPTLKRLLFVLA